MERAPIKRTEAAKKEAFEALCEGIPDAVFILGHDVVENEEKGTFKSGSYADVDVLGRIGGAKSRSIAGAQLHATFPEATVVANSFVPGKPFTHARVTAGDLEKRGVDEDSILLQEDSYSTFTELIELIKLVLEKDWEHVAVLTSDLQMPRAQALLEHIHDLTDPQGESKKPEVQRALAAWRERPARITFVSSEEVLLASDPHFKRVIDAARQLPSWRKTKEMEDRGAAQIRSGEYWKQVPK